MILTTSCHARYWCAQWSAQGKRHSKNLGATATMSRRDAQAAMEALIGAHALHPATKTAKGGTRLGEWLARHETLRSDLAEGSMDLVKRTGFLLREFFTADPRLDRITPSDAQDWRLWLEERTGRREAGLSSSTVALHIRNAKAILNAAIRDGLLGQNPFSALRSVKGGKVESWSEITVEQFERIIDVLPDHHWKVLFALCRLGGTRSGERGGEALNMEWPAIDWNRHMMRVEDAKRHCTRTTPTVPRLYEILREAHEAAEPGQALVCPVNRASLNRKARRYVVMAGLDPYPKVLHSLRKSCVSDLAERFPAYAVARWVGHSTKVAAKFYYEPSASLLSEITGLTRTVVKAQQKSAPNADTPS